MKIYIYQRQRKEGNLQEQDRFYESTTVDLPNIDNDRSYFGEFIFIPRTSGNILKSGRKTDSAEYSNSCEVGPQSYGTVFE